MLRQNWYHWEKRNVSNQSLEAQLRKQENKNQRKGTNRKQNIRWPKQLQINKQNTINSLIRRQKLLESKKEMFLIKLNDIQSLKIKEWKRCKDTTNNDRNYSRGFK